MHLKDRKDRLERKIRQKKTDNDNSVRKLLPVTELESEDELENESDIEAF